MAYRIRFMKAGSEVAATDWPGSIENTISVALINLPRHALDTTTITDKDGVIVWTAEARDIQQ